jgi:hypothetical protein
MPTLTTRGGEEITFKASDIDAIADHSDITGRPGTCVYGIIPAIVEINETVQGFMQRLDIEGNFAKFTRPNGWLVWINGDSVASLRAPLPGEYAAGTQAVISAGSVVQGVKEKPSDVTAAVNAHGGHL